MSFLDKIRIHTSSRVESSWTASRVMSSPPTHAPSRGWLITWTCHRDVSPPSGTFEYRAIYGSLSFSPCTNEYVSRNLQVFTVARTFRDMNDNKVFVQQDCASVVFLTIDYLFVLLCTASTSYLEPTPIRACIPTLIMENTTPHLVGHPTLIWNVQLL